jgi:hypothetical protein
VATTVSETPVKKPKLTQSALSVIKKEGTAPCVFAPQHKKSEEQTKVVDSADLSAAVEICESPEKKNDLTPEEQAIINSQLRSVDLLENPNEGDPIRESIVEGNALYMTNNAAVIQSCFASNNSFLHRLLDGTTEKCIPGIQFQRSDLMRMLSPAS